MGTILSIIGIIVMVGGGILINKSTEVGGFNWIKHHLRVTWMIYLFLLSILIFSNTNILELTMKLNKNWNKTGYLICFVIGGLLLCSYWYFAGRISKSAEKKNTQNAQTTEYRYINGKELNNALRGKETAIVAIWNDGTVEPQTLAIDLGNGLMMAGWKLVDGGTKIGDAQFFPDSFSIEVSSVRASEDDHAIQIAENLKVVLETKFHIDAKIHFTAQPFPRNFIRIKISGR